MIAWHVQAVRWLRTAALFCMALVLTSGILYAQAEPEAPESVLRPEKQKNGWQISFYTGVSLNEFYEGYDIENVIDFLANETSWNMPLGFSINVPIYEELSLYLRAGIQNSKTNFFNGEVDSLVSANETGEIGYNMDFTFELLQVDVLVRLIGNNEGERVYFGPSFGFTKTKRIVVQKKEYLTGYSEQLIDEDMPGADSFFPMFVIGGEYAFVPVRNLYIIPAIEVNFGWEKISSVQRLRSNSYRLLLNISYQVF